MNAPLQTTPYPAFVGPVAETLGRWLPENAFSRIFVLCDGQTHRHCLPFIQPLLPSDTAFFTLKSPYGHSLEHLKSMAVAEQVWEAMLSASLDRQALMINLGGGVVGDLGGFCAALYKRGIRYVQVPTTLLAMTDAALGGKLGVDFQGLKNMIGVFAAPAAVFADPFWLNTLPPRELLSGFAEVIKHALIGDPGLWAQLTHGPHPLRMQPADWPTLLAASMQVKLRIVQEDPLEKGLRKLLNFGHTAGHALESWFLQTPEPITHGEAVVMGMLIESHVAQHGLFKALRAYTDQLYPRRHIPAWAYHELWALMQHDKKNEAQAVVLALPGTTPFSLELMMPRQESVFEAFSAYNHPINK
ncbi:MAG: 3-dehydroquinate synthase [Saprospiraceae bacterium]